MQYIERQTVKFRYFLIRKWGRDKLEETFFLGFIYEEGFHSHNFEVGKKDGDREKKKDQKKLKKNGKYNKKMQQMEEKKLNPKKRWTFPMMRKSKSFDEGTISDSASFKSETSSFKSETSSISSFDSGSSMSSLASVDEKAHLMKKQLYLTKNCNRQHIRLLPHQALLKFPYPEDIIEDVTALLIS